MGGAHSAALGVARGPPWPPRESCWWRGGSHLTFFIDDWDLLLHRRGFNAGAFLDPHVNHLIVGPAALWKAIEATFGMDSQIPYAMPRSTLFLASVRYSCSSTSAPARRGVARSRRRTPRSCSWEPHTRISSTSSKSVTSARWRSGSARCSAFERGDTRGDVLACLLLLASLAFAEIAFAFAAACVVTIALGRWPWRRAWVVAAPLVVYLGWYAGWGDTGTNSISLDSVPTSPAYVLDGFASSLA